MKTDMIKKIIHKQVKEIISENFKVTPITFVPKIDDTRLTFGNTAFQFEATTLFIDMRNSTEKLNNHQRQTVAKIHMAYFRTIVIIARFYKGDVRSFNGDSALIFFQGNTEDSISNAVKAARQIKHMLSDSENGINKLLDKRYSEIDFGIGMDTGEILCTKIGYSGGHNRDLFWIGNCVNKSTRIGNLCKSPNHIGISNKVYEKLNNNEKYEIQQIYDQNKYVEIWTQSMFNYNGVHEYFYAITK